MRVYITELEVVCHQFYLPSNDTSTQLSQENLPNSQLIFQLRLLNPEIPLTRCVTQALPQLTPPNLFVPGLLSHAASTLSKLQIPEHRWTNLSYPQLKPAATTSVSPLWVFRLAIVKLTTKRRGPLLQSPTTPRSPLRRPLWREPLSTTHHLE